MNAYVLPSSGGVVVGALFERCAEPGDDPVAHASFSDDEVGRILGTQGRRLVKNYWGDYVAFLVDSRLRQRWIMKDPTGTLPCLRVEHAGVQVFFSCIEDCMALKIVQLSVNWAYVAEHVAGGWTNADIQPLLGLDEVTRGECIELDAQTNQVTKRQLHWSPFTFSEDAGSIGDATEAGALLRRTVRQCTRTWAACHKRIVLRLSGGLDSSIVLGSLGELASEAEKVLTCITYYGTNPGADPRPWARMAATRARAEHIEVPVNASTVALSELLDAAPTPAPNWLLSYYLARRNYGHIVRQLRATAIFTGDGGDSGFGSLSIGRAIDESLKQQGFGLRTLRLASAIAAYRDTTAVRVLIGALRRRAVGSRLKDNALLFDKLGQLASPEVKRRVLEHDRFPHPWFSSVPGVPWGLIYRVSTLLMRPEYYDPFGIQTEVQAARVHPLHSQPVVELCLRIPLYVHFLGGRDRGLARRAFVSEVPEGILQRQWKDRDANVNTELVSNNLDFLRSLLVDGVLVREGLLDRSKINEALSMTPTRYAADLSVLLHYLHVELWVRKWRDQAMHRAA